MMGIYRFVHRESGRSYIGQSIRLEARYRNHKNNHLNSNLHDYHTKFYNALRKYGFDSFDCEILEQHISITKEELNEKEKYYIEKFDSFYNGFNSNLGGERVTYSKEWFGEILD